MIFENSYLIPKNSIDMNKFLIVFTKKTMLDKKEEENLKIMKEMNDSLTFIVLIHCKIISFFNRKRALQRN